MGNTLLDAHSKNNPMKDFEAWLEQMPELSNKQLLYENKIFKTFSFNLKNQRSSIIIKIYLKEKNAQTQQSISIYYQQFQFLLSKLHHYENPNLLLYNKFINFEKDSELNFVAIARQRMANTLMDRFLTTPNLLLEEVHWILTQTIISLFNIHSVGLFHGNLRSSNVLLTSSLHVYLTDIATYKPHIINEQDLSEFRLFYVSSQIQCTLAPEKFKDFINIESSGNQNGIGVNSGITSNISNQLDNIFNVGEIIGLDKITKEQLEALQKMDMFSLGCLIAETYLNGATLFSYEQLHQYRKNEYDPTILIDKIEEQSIKDLVKNLIQPEKDKRYNIEEVVKYWFKHIVNPIIYSFYYYLDAALYSNYFSNPDLRITLIREFLPFVFKYILKQKIFAPKLVYSMPLPIQSLPIDKYFIKSIQSIKPDLFNLIEQEPLLFTEQKLRMKEQCQNMSTLDQNNSQQQNNYNQGQSFQDANNNCEFENNFNLYCRNFKDIYAQFLEKIMKESQANPEKEEKPDVTICSELKILALNVCTNIRNAKFVASKLVGIELLLVFSRFLSDYDNFHLILSYLCSLFEDIDSTVICLSLEVFTEIIGLLKEPFQIISDTSLYKEFIWINIVNVSKNKDPNVQRCFAENIGKITKAAQMLCISANTVIEKERTKSKIREQQQQQQQQLQTNQQIQNQQQMPSNQNNAIFDLQIELNNIYNFIVEYFQSNIATSNVIEILISNLVDLCKIVGEQITSNKLLTYLISCINYPNLKRFVLQHIPDIAQYITINESNVNYMLACFDHCLYEQNEIHIFYAIRFFKIMTRRSFFQKHDLDILKKICPLMLHHHNWIRNEAIEYVQTILQIYGPSDTYINFQSEIQQYLTHRLPVLNKDILVMLLPKITDKSTPKDTNNFDKQFIELFNTKYKALSKKAPTNNIVQNKDKEFKLLDQLNQNILNKKCSAVVSLTKKTNEFLYALIKSQIIYQIEVLQEKDQIKEIKDQSIDEQIRKILYNRKIFVDNYLDITNHRLNFFVHIFQHLGMDQNFIPILSIQQNKQAYYNLNHKNFLSSLIIVNQLLYRMKLFINQEDLDLGHLDSLYNPQHEQSSVFLKQNQPWKPLGQLITTIWEHTDVVTCLDVTKDSRLLISGSHDGTIRIFDINILEQDCTTDSKLQINVDGEDAYQINKIDQQNNNIKKQKIKCIKVLEDTSSLLVGTDKGNINLYRIDSGKDSYSLLRKYKVQGSVKCIESLNQEENEKCFIYVTTLGEIGVKDIRIKNQSALTYQIAKERGLVSSMILRQSQKGQNQTAIIGTLNGYCLLYDIRSNMVQYVYQLYMQKDGPAQPASILSLANFYKFTNIDYLSTNELVAISFASDNHEVGFFNLFHNTNEINSTNPVIYMLSTQKEQETYRLPYLKNMNNQETLQNYWSINDMQQYNFVPRFDETLDVLNYLQDPMIIKHKLTKERWMDCSKNCYSKITNIFKQVNCVNKIICLPNLILNQSPYLPKNIENYILTAGNDRSIRLWNMVSDPIKGDFQLKKYYKGFQICNTQNKERAYQLCSFQPDNLVLHEFEKTNQNQVYKEKGKEEVQTQFNLMDKRCFHKDDILDIAFIDRGSSALIASCSRDKTIKIWK